MGPAAQRPSLCRNCAGREGSSPHLHRQRLHRLQRGLPLLKAGRRGHDTPAATGDVPEGSELTGYAQRQALRFQLRAAMWWDGDSLAGEQAARVLARYADTPPAAGSSQAYICTMAHLRVARGEYAAAEAAPDRLRAARIPGLSGADSASYANYSKLCAALLDAARASGLGSPDAHDRLVEADSLARDFIFEICCGVSVPEANLLLARLWEKEGDLPRRLSEVAGEPR